MLARTSSKHVDAVTRLGYKVGCCASGDADASELVTTLCEIWTVRTALLELDKALDLYTAASLAEARQLDLVLFGTRPVDV